MEEKRKEDKTKTYIRIYRREEERKTIQRNTLEFVGDEERKKIKQRHT